ncbi:MAG: hypothetical protein K2M93_02360 [Muribaculaceae bacterium]|nr:hypothetical protein [Muribaculaceae bacterium]
MNNKYIVKIALSTLLITSGALISYAAGAVRLKDGSSLTWREFVNGVKSLGTPLTAAELDAAYNAYMNAPSITANAKQTYDNAKKAFDACDKELTPLKNEMDRCQKTYDNYTTEWNTVVGYLVDDRAEIRRLESAISTNQGYYDNWPTEKVRGSLTSDASSAISDYQSFYSKLSSSSNLVYCNEAGTTVRGDIYPSKSTDTYSRGGVNFVAKTVSQFVSLCSGKSVMLLSSYYCHTPTTTRGNNLQFTGGSATSMRSSITSKINTMKDYDDNYTSATIQDVKNYQGFATKAACLTQINKDKASLEAMNKRLASDEEWRDAVGADRSAASKDLSNATYAYNRKKSEWDTLKNQLDTASANYEAAKTAEANATAAWENALKKSNDYKYQDVTLDGDVVADVQIANYNGVINGGGYVITPGTGVSQIFSNFSGSLTNIAVNGSMNGIKGKVRNVAYWDGKNKAGGYYDNNGATKVYKDLAELGFNIRKHFGVNFNKTGALISLTETNKVGKVYKLTIHKGPMWYDEGYFQCKYEGGKRTLISADETLELDDNIFVYSATSDVDDIEMPNVFYSGSGNDGSDGAYLCNNLLINLNAFDFYCPVNMTAKNVTVRGDITPKNGRAGICLPFSLKQEYFPSGTSLCSFNKDTGTSFVFTKVASDVPANTPVLIFSNKSSISMNLSGAKMVHVAQTPDNYRVTGGCDKSDMSSSFGSYMAAVSYFFDSIESNGMMAYALRNGVFTPINSNIFGNSHEAYDDEDVQYGSMCCIKPFRIFIGTTKMSQTEHAMSAPRYVSIVDELGNEISNTSGIDLVEASAVSFAVAGGDGEIIITSDADFGMVDIYDLTGRMIGTINVLGGDNRIAVQNGVYILAGQKVMVK